ncbi:hypothetical protein ASG80_19040 [Agromyces sp. Soil535]|nr:hypothetical protein ASG80_19040 [Agromyces sp. Soil535]
MARVEYQIETLPTADDALANGRLTYRQMQLMAAVSDDPLTAAAELERLGFEVVPPSGNLPLRPNEY